jgi:hypothetical protein
MVNSDEKSVKFTGNAMKVEAACKMLLDALSECAPQRDGAREYVPQGVSAHATSGQNGRPQNDGRPGGNPYGGPGGPGGGGGYGGGGGEKVVQRLAIPSMCAGAVIGKAGSVIRSLVSALTLGAVNHY